MFAEVTVFALAEKKTVLRRLHTPSEPVLKEILRNSPPPTIFALVSCDEGPYN